MHLLSGLAKNNFRQVPRSLFPLGNPLSVAPIRCFAVNFNGSVRVLALLHSRNTLIPRRSWRVQGCFRLGKCLLTHQGEFPTLGEYSRNANGLFARLVVTNGYTNLRVALLQCIFSWLIDNLLFFQTIAGEQPPYRGLASESGREDFRQ